MIACPKSGSGKPAVQPLEYVSAEIPARPTGGGAAEDIFTGEKHHETRHNIKTKRAWSNLPLYQKTTFAKESPFKKEPLRYTQVGLSFLQ